MGDVTPFPVPPARFSPQRVPAIVAAADPVSLPETGGRRGEYALADIARALGLLHLSPRVIITHLRAQARHNGMPLPKTPRIVSGAPVDGPRRICKLSRWDAGRFDAWLDGRGPSSPAAPVAPAIRDEMRRRAQLIAVGQ